MWDISQEPILGTATAQDMLPKLHHRSDELWSPLVALAAFFEEQGGIVGMLDAISSTAEWDEQMSEGK